MMSNGYHTLMFCDSLDSLEILWRVTLAQNNQLQYIYPSAHHQSLLLPAATDQN